MSTPYELNEPIVRGLVNTLRANLNDQIGQLNEATSDDYWLPMVENRMVLDHVPIPTEIGSGNLPCIGIQDGPSTIEDDTVSTATGRHQLALVLICAHQDQSVLGWQLRRLTRAVFNTIQLDRTYGGACWQTTFKGTTPGPMLGARPDSGEAGWLSWTWVKLESTREEV